MKAICQQCKKTFDTSERNKKFCSQACYTIAQRHYWNCMQCGKEFYRAKCRIPNLKKVFCSKKCAGEHKTREPITLKCGTCSEEFTVHPTTYEKNKTKYCSSRCYGKAKRTENYNRKAQVARSWRCKSGWTQFSESMLTAHTICEICGEPSQVIHHKEDPNETKDTRLLFELANLQFLCRSCHPKVHNPANSPAQSRPRAR